MINQEIKKAIKILNQGGIVVFPTDTAYGVGCRIDNIKAIERLFKIRNRPLTQPVPVLVNSLSMTVKYCEQLTDLAKKLISRYWPGALTIVVKCNKNLVPSLVRGGGETIGLRMPNHPIPLEIIKELNSPVLGPSANFHTKPTPYSFEELDPEFLKLVDYTIKGNCSLKKESTVVDTTQKNLKILRQGALEIYLPSKNVVLYIDSSNQNKITVGLDINGKKILITRSDLRAQDSLSLIDELLKNNSLGICDLAKIQVKTGPGSYTGLRIGITIANTLSSVLKIPLNNKKLGELEMPIYQ